MAKKNLLKKIRERKIELTLEELLLLVQEATIKGLVHGTEGGSQIGKSLTEEIIGKFIAGGMSDEEDIDFNDDETSKEEKKGTMGFHS